MPLSSFLFYLTFIGCVLTWKGGSLGVVVDKGVWGLNWSHIFDTVFETITATNRFTFVQYTCSRFCSVLGSHSSVSSKKLVFDFGDHLQAVLLQNFLSFFGISPETVDWALVNVFQNRHQRKALDSLFHIEFHLPQVCCPGSVWLWSIESNMPWLSSTRCAVHFRLIYRPFLLATLH